MTAKYIIVPELSLKYVKVTDTTDFSELYSLALMYFDDPLFSDDNRFIIDLTFLTNTKASFKDVLKLKNIYSDRFRYSGKAIQIAIIAPTSLGYGISRMFASLAATGKVMKVMVSREIDDVAHYFRLSLNDINECRLAIDA
jgi:hypothetical protein